MKQDRRQRFDALYSRTEHLDHVARQQRVREAYPLLLGFCRSGSEEDDIRLAQLGRDVLVLEAHVIQEMIPTSRLSQLVHLLLGASRRCEFSKFSSLLLIESDCWMSRRRSSAELIGDVYMPTVLHVTKTDSKALQPRLPELYETLSELFRHEGSPRLLRVLRECLTVCLTNKDEEMSVAAYTALTWNFLAQPNLSFFEAKVSEIATSINLSKVASAVLSRPTEDLAAVPTAHSLWLLAHFLDIQGRQHTSLSSLQLRTLFMLLSVASTEITGPSSKGGRQSMPTYVAQQIATLIDKAQISSLLDRFTSDQAGTSEEAFENASLLAGYILTLIRYFPDQSDDIRMRLYLADILTPEGRVPSVSFFWRATSQTRIYACIATDEPSVVNMLQHRKLPGMTSLADTGSLWEREWRTIVLFLELYIFILRLSDDEDFFSGLNPSPLATSKELPSRLRSCSLSQDDLETLTTFLKNLSFNLFYHASRLFAATTGTSQIRDGTDPNTYTKRHSAGTTRTQDIIPGLDFPALRTVASTAMQMLYERDSRRAFLPPEHWLMTNKFDMQSFQNSVTLEEQRRNEMEESGNEQESSEDEDAHGEDGLPTFNWASAARRPNAVQAEKARLRQKRLQRERMLAEVAPKLEILRHMPFVIPFDMRVQIFRQFVFLDKYKRRKGHVDPDQWRMAVHNPLDFTRSAVGRHHATIKRGKLFEDAMNQFYELGEGLKEPIQITFVDKFDQEEAGIDGGGVTKEFLTSVITEAFTGDQRLFVTNEKNLFYPNPSILDQTKEYLRAAEVMEGTEEWQEYIGHLLRSYEFLGRVVGKCMYEGILIDIAFAGFFLLKWSSAGNDSAYRATINDLREMDEELYQGLLRLKNYPGNLSELDLDFTIEDQISMPGEPVRTITRSLIPNGDKVPVTNENRPLYMSYVTRHRLVAQPLLQTRAFLRGLGSIITPSWLSMFNQSELQRLIGGDSTEINVDDLERNTIYSGLYERGDSSSDHPTIQLFWQVMRGLKDSERRDVLKYVTSTPRSPLLGFSQLNPKFSIRDGGTDQDRLPSASTCVNLLKLPQYRTAKVMREKLLYAVTAGAGFDLS
jgi:ubiquitin-protein ligase E3 C